MLTEPLSAGLEKYSFTQSRTSHVSLPIAQIQHGAYLSAGSIEARPVW